MSSSGNERLSLEGEDAMEDLLPAAEIVQARAATYQFLLAALEGPTPEQYRWMSGSDFAQALESLCESYSLTCPAGPYTPETFADHESRYLACFEVGLPGPPVPLLASHYNRREPVPRIIHEHILLYRRFGVQVRTGSLEPADHLVNQLAFLLRLDELTQSGSVDAESLLRARHDLLTRHLVRWTPLAAAVTEEKHLPPVYCVLLALLAAAVEQDRELTATALKDLPGENA
jgi:DMSO reductase family type II enzyme chaperone